MCTELENNLGMAKYHRMDREVVKGLATEGWWK